MARLFEWRDLKDVLAIQASSPEIAQWSADDYGAVVRGEMTGWVAEAGAGKTITGFIVARRAADEIEILNLAIRRDERRKGVGSGLIHQALEWGAALGCKKAFLEVRESNATALPFYEHHGFQLVGRRARYYEAPQEDALVLCAVLGPAPRT